MLIHKRQKLELHLFIMLFTVMTLMWLMWYLSKVSLFQSSKYLMK